MSRKRYLVGKEESTAPLVGERFSRSLRSGIRGTRRRGFRSGRTEARLASPPAANDVTRRPSTSCGC